jgi:tetratricopeptide (TPR) repeat protein
VRQAQRLGEDARAIAESSHPEDVQVALDALKRADSLVALAQQADPQWRRLWTDRGWLAAEGARLSGGARRVAALRQGLEMAAAAVRDSPDDADALELRGTLRARLVAELQVALDEPDRIQKAEADLRTALDRDSTLVRAWATLGNLLWSKGSIAEAERASRRALQEDAYLAEAQSTYRELFYADLMLGNFPLAAEWCRRGRLAFPDNWRFVECELTLMRHDRNSTPNADSAWALVERLTALDPADKAASEGRSYHSIYRRIVAATISAHSGRRDVARTEIARARRATRADSVLSLDLNYDEAYLRLVLGERAQAARLLEEYIAARPLSRDYLARDPLLTGLYHQP